MHDYFSDRRLTISKNSSFSLEEDESRLNHSSVQKRVNDDDYNDDVPKLELNLKNRKLGNSGSAHKKS